MISLSTARVLGQIYQWPRAVQVHSVGGGGAGAAAAVRLQDGLLHSLRSAHQGGRDVSAAGTACRDLRATAPVLEHAELIYLLSLAWHYCCPALPVLKNSHLSLLTWFLCPTRVAIPICSMLECLRQFVTAIVIYLLQ